MRLHRERASLAREIKPRGHPSHVAHMALTPFRAEREHTGQETEALSKYDHNRQKIFVDDRCCLFV